MFLVLTFGLFAASYFSLSAGEAHLAATLQMVCFLTVVPVYPVYSVWRKQSANGSRLAERLISSCVSPSGGSSSPRSLRRWISRFPCLWVISVRLSLGVASWFVILYSLFLYYSGICWLYSCLIMTELKIALVCQPTIAIIYIYGSRVSATEAINPYSRALFVIHIAQSRRAQYRSH